MAAETRRSEGPNKLVIFIFEKSINSWKRKTDFFTIVELVLGQILTDPKIRHCCVSDRLPGELWPAGQPATPAHHAQPV